MTVLFFGFRLASDATISNNKVRLAIIAFANTLLFGHLQFRQEILGRIKKLGMPLPESEFSDDGVTVLVVLATVTVAYLVLRSLQEPPAMGKPETTIEDVLRKITNLDRLDILKQTLRGHLDQIDNTTRWNDANYVPLEAEVQVLERRTSRRRIVDLLVALRSDQRTRIFIVLGDPGTGKSVAMRKLTRDLLGQSQTQSRIPIYVNLKEWRTDRAWTIDAPPTPQDFYDFLYHNVLDRLDYNSKSFLQQMITSKVYSKRDSSFCARFFRRDSCCPRS